MSNSVNKNAAFQSQSQSQVRKAILTNFDTHTLPQAQCASIICSTHGPDFMRSLLQSLINIDMQQQPAIKELLPYLIQDTLLRGTTFQANHVARKFWQELDLNAVPLAWLPLRLASCESLLQSVLPQHSLNGSSNQISVFTPSHTLAADSPKDDLDGLEFKMQAANDQIDTGLCLTEAKLFNFGTELNASTISPDLLMRLGLDCLSGASLANTFIERIEPAAAMEILFGFACNGGAYGPGAGPALGRLNAWKSLAEMSGVGLSRSNFSEVEKAVEQSLWFGFVADGDWFCNVAWDIGLVCLRQDRRHLYVLAATEED